MEAQTQRNYLSILVGLALVLVSATSDFLLAGVAVGCYLIYRGALAFHHTECQPVGFALCLSAILTGPWMGSVLATGLMCGGLTLFCSGHGMRA